jgi:membrane-associated phospholipid phosphatase
MDRAAWQHRLWRGRVFLLLAILFVLAMLLDSAIAHWASPHYRVVKHDSTVARLIKEMGAARVMFGVIVLLCIFHARHWFAGALVLATAGIGGVFELILKWSVGRTRPVQGQVISIDPFNFDHFRGGLVGFVQQSNLCFPSGHSTLAFAMAACLTYLLPRWRILWFALATLVGLERVAELAHYPSDVIGGAICGILAFYIALHLFERFDPAKRLRGFDVEPAPKAPSAG